ncbi:MAG: TonB-dependent receptor, partial [Saprospirales bacterium]|nr:TonB-dependent receptor [Saprospirales bacterium]
YYEAQQAGGLTDADFALDARQSHRARNWFSAPWNVASARTQYDFSKKTRLELKLFALVSERNSIGFVRPISTADTISKSTGSYAPRQLDRDQYRNGGGELRFLTSYILGGREQTLAAGVRYFNGYTHRRQLGAGDTGAGFNTELQADRFPRDLHFDTRNAAVFAEHIFRAGKRFALVPGLRLENAANTIRGRINTNAAGEAQAVQPDERTRAFLLAGFGAEYHATHTSEVYVNISQAYRPVGFADLTPPASTAVIDPGLRDSRGWVADLGYRGRWKEILNFDVSLFYLNYADRIGALARLADDGTVYQFRTNLSASKHRGVEAYVEFNPLAFFYHTRRIGNLHLFASLSWLDARYTDLPVTTVSNGVIAETNLKGKFVDNAPKHLHRFGATYAWHGFSATWQLSRTAAVYTDAANTDAPSANGQIGRIPGYSLMDLSATMDLLNNFTLRAGINNLADARYATRRSGGYPGPGLLPGEGRTWYVGLGMRF